mmetsp:Transcript_38328/g.61501  ORF Transcript_38328/g.61501 Transcript_38328/m.61501 type:complete len:136 (-) Transcript_38328:213-620(-)
MAVRGGVVRTSSVAAGMLAMMLLFVHVEQAEGKGNNGKNRRNQSLDREVKARRGECEMETRDHDACNASIIDLENCLLRCISHSCYDVVYGGDALEDGEVDIVRGRTFRSCARNELRNIKVAEVEKMNLEKKAVM